MAKNVIFDIGNILMDFRWKDYMHSLFGDDMGTIDAVNRAIWRSGSWAAIDAGAPADEAIEAAVRSEPEHEADISGGHSREPGKPCTDATTRSLGYKTSRGWERMCTIFPRNGSPAWNAGRIS